MRKVAKRVTCVGTEHLRSGATDPAQQQCCGLENVCVQGCAPKKTIFCWSFL
jgi:hypothetical protein